MIVQAKQSFHGFLEHATLVLRAVQYTQNVAEICYHGDRHTTHSAVF